MRRRWREWRLKRARARLQETYRLLRNLPDHAVVSPKDKMWTTKHSILDCSTCWAVDDELGDGAKLHLKIARLKAKIGPEEPPKATAREVSRD